MGQSEKKPLIGIVGGIGSGKSTVAQLLSQLGCRVIDCDQIAHELLEKSAIKQKIIHDFGKKILTPSGRISRKKVSRSAFNNRDQLQMLQNILHPAVMKKVDRLVQYYQRLKQPKAIAVDMPLLVETGWYRRCDHIIFIDCDASTRAKRAQKTLHLSKNELQKRENFQISLDKKKTIADNTIENNSDLSALAGQVEDLFSQLV